ncbi:RidA family protein [Pseudobacter ginsenosidimutans]|uniref:Enamine deaminase RidA (YjgF/YER057c/UK114 family) n=1 Tax=Pseudobacter ginsenosidimutans TaxID=661488 RepID=A0A4V2EZ78_9BACT|nr:RidA family protein [Pseudobacter ginsenosidimutans]RZS65540.1 enamine deaminase RidA (YjgF/YER057c/UK114 family) [Pseudobacter ginsenosidimutans]
MLKPILVTFIVSTFLSCKTSSIMQTKTIDPTGYGYSQAYEVSNARKLLFVSGQVPEDEKGNVPPDFPSQCALAWKNIEDKLKKAGMTLENIVKVNVYLSDRKYRGKCSDGRPAILQKTQPAMTIIITGIYDEIWLLEIEVVAAA